MRNKIFIKIGRKVICQLVDRKTGEVFLGAAKCSPKDDFDYLTGEKLALLRAKIKKDKTNLKDARARIKELTKELNGLYEQKSAIEANLFVNTSWLEHTVTQL